MLLNLLVGINSFNLCSKFRIHFIGVCITDLVLLGTYVFEFTNVLKFCLDSHLSSFNVVHKVVYSLHIDILSFILNSAQNAYFKLNLEILHCFALFMVLWDIISQFFVFRVDNISIGLYFLWWATLFFHWRYIKVLIWFEGPFLVIDHIHNLVQLLSLLLSTRL